LPELGADPLPELDAELWSSVDAAAFDGGEEATGEEELTGDELLTGDEVLTGLEEVEDAGDGATGVVTGCATAVALT
jgi:hypothetical protein